MRTRDKMGKKQDKNRDKIDHKQDEKTMTIPVGKAAEIMGISKRTLLKHAQEWDVKFEWDGRGRRVSISEIRRLLGGDVSWKKKIKA